jgi:hypothetical protein
MRTEPLQARSFAVVEAAITGYATILAVIAFGRWWGLIISDDWAAPLIIAMGITFAGDLLLANKHGQLNWQTVSALLTIKCLLVLAVGMAFTVQRMNIGDPTAKPWGHYTLGSAVIYEMYRFARVLDGFGVYLGPISAILEWSSKAFGGGVRAAIIDRTEMRSAKAGWKAAQESCWETGDVGPPPNTAELSGLIKALNADDSDPAIDTQKEGGGERLDSGSAKPPPPAP